jgi:hypothetical protein
VHENYKGRKLHFSSDIALLKLNVSVELTWAVLPVCVDWRNEYERFQLSNGFLGTVSFSFEMSIQKNTQNLIVTIIAFIYVDSLEQ